MWSSYFDDFLCVSTSEASRHTDMCVSTLFSILGWKVSEQKLLDFSSVCKVLGVTLDLTQSGDRMCWVTNTEERKQELVEEISVVLKRGYIKPKDVERLRGRLQSVKSSAGLSGTA